MASSSSAIDSSDNYDVFLSFRGEDTRYNFTSHLYKSLVGQNIKTFIDYDIRRGQEITEAIERAIEGAKMSIIVFSKRYAESMFCLDELLKAMECRESKAQIVLPIFYKVEPSEEVYEEAFKSHGKETLLERFKSAFRKLLGVAGVPIDDKRYIIVDKETKVQRWKAAFRKALELAGVVIDNKSNEAEKIEEITDKVLVALKEMNISLSKGEELKGASLVGRTAENNCKKIWECLMNDEISRVGIYGMGGVGKTTIATHINNQLLEVANSFTHIYWLTVSNDLSIYNLQSSIAKKINLDLLGENNEKRRAAMIQEKLRNEKFALILDDVGKAFEIGKLGIPPLVDGQKLLVTSRSRKVCIGMECLPIEVKPLSEQEALDLFIKESKCQINDSLQLGKIVGSIVEECSGLPLAVVVIARRMRGIEGIWKWRETLRELQKPCECEDPEIEENLYKVLKYSYDNLPSDLCRQCFLYCSLFPEDHVFKRDSLIEYWIGEGLIYGVESRYEELDKGYCVLDELVHASLLEIVVCEVWEKIKMHDVIRDMAHKIVKAGLQFEDSFESIQVLQKLKSFPNSTWHFSKLKTLVLAGQDIKELSSCFSADMQSLNVLHLNAAVNIQSIPDSISNLGNLRVLIIRSCYCLRYIPSLAKLKNLRHLELSRNKSLEEIPKGIERLVKLKVLELSYFGSFPGSFPSYVLEKLSNLQTLNLRNPKDSFGGYSAKLEPEVQSLISLEKLETLHVNFYNLHNLNCYVKSGHWRKLLQYQIYYGGQPGVNWVKEQYSKTMNLEEIRDCEDWEEEFGLFLPDDIQSLELVRWDSPMLYYLKNPNFANLRAIRIKGYKSKYLFTVELAHLIRSVEYLCIEYSKTLEEIIGRGEEEDEKWVNRSNYRNYPTILLPNLKKLSLLSLQQLRTIHRGRMVCPSLELLEIELCDNIERLPFCIEKEGNKQNQTIILRTTVGEEYPISRRWWNSLQWDDPGVKSMYLPILSPNEDDDVILSLLFATSFQLRSIHRMIQEKECEWAV